MNLLVVGSGGREHALVYKLKQSRLCGEIYCAPGNAGIAKIATCVDIAVDDIEGLCNFAKENYVGLTVVGPELPLVLGITDKFISQGLKVFGPNKQCAAFEGSKALTKAFLTKYKIPTAKYLETVSADEAKENLDKFGFPVVIKADGLAGGKGVLICDDKQEALSGITDLMENKILGNAADTLVIEEYLDGVETSLLCFMDGKTIVPMASSKDYKRIYDADEGPNTGGMGAFSPNPLVTHKLSEKINNEILQPILNGFKKENLVYKGVLYVGLMIVEGQPKVLEFNVRFGDPETQVLMLRLESDLVEVMLKCTDGILDADDVVWSENSSICVVAASGGYPGKYETGKLINFSPIIDDAVVFHAGTMQKDGHIYTSGGRVLNVCASAPELSAAREIVYDTLDRIHFDDMFYRHDIALIEE